MAEPQAYLNGVFIPEAKAAVSVGDAGFVQGTTVAEQLRTFGGKLFRLDAHIERLFRSLSIIEVDPGLTPGAFAQIAIELAARNHPLLATGDDLGLTIFVTPGPYQAMDRGGSLQPTIGLHTFPLRFDLWADKYQRGQALATTDVAQVSARCWPPELKCRSRMHYYLADREARRRFPDSRALMLDEDGFVTETTTANVVLFQNNRGLITPPAEKILPGISLGVLLELAEQLGIAHESRDLAPADVAAAEEVFLTSTSVCMLPVVRFNGREIGSGKPGAAFHRLMTAWGELAGLDILKQAERFASR